MWYVAIKFNQKVVKKLGEINDWFVYVLRCADNSLYTGITTDVTRRVDEHNGVNGNKSGAKYTRARQPVMVVYQEQADSRSLAAKREAAIKKLPKQEKEQLIAVK